MAIPTRYRALLEDICSNDLVITIDMKSTCLTLSPLPEWKKFEEKVSALPAMDELGEMLSRFVVGQAKDLQVDGSGRILIPQSCAAMPNLIRSLCWWGELSGWRSGRKRTGTPSATSPKKIIAAC